MADGHMIDIKRGSHFLALVWLVVGALLLPQPPALGDLDIRFDYRYDTRGFFSGANIERRQILEAAAAIFEERISSTSPSITPSGINRWTLSFDNPNTGTAVTLTNLHVPAGTMIVFVGARSISSDALAYAQFGYGYFGDSAWVKLFVGKDNSANFSPFGGAITFDESTPWFFDLTPDTLDPFPDKYDFFSVAIHEIGHLLGFYDYSRAFAALSVEGDFWGPVSQSLYGGPIPMGEDGSHWQQDVLFEGSPPAMTTTIYDNERKSFSKLDFAALVDIGYELKLSVPKIVVQTGSQTKTVGEPVSLTVQASGSGVLSYSWLKNGVPLLNVGGVTGANGPTLSFASVQLSQAGGYSVVVSNLVGSVVSAIVQLTVNPAQAAPTIVVQPVSTAVRVGQQVTLGVQAAGSSPLSYQWQRNGANLPGATGAELVIRSTTLNDAGEYRVVVSNSRGSVTSSPAFVAVLAPEYLPMITQQPQSTNLVVGQRLELKVVSNGNPEPGYQWRKDGVNLLGGNGSVLVKSSVVLTDAGLYQVAVTNSVGQVLSARVTVTVVPETIVARIVGFREIVGGDLDFDLDAPSGREWVLEDSTILGTWSEVSRFLANQPRFSLRVPSQPTNSRFFRLRQADSGASAPVITKQPEGLTVKAGNNAVFTVVAEGTGPMSHQWLFNGVAIPGAGQASLILANVQAINAGNYRVVISNSVGNVTSSEAMLTVNPDKPVDPSGFVWIAPGTFLMGSPVSEDGRDSSEVIHTVTLTQGFWMSDHETTQGEYQLVMGSNPSYRKGESLPVEQVSWDDAVAYCRKLTEREQAAGRITSQQAYRLPTEAEWEYAARAGTAGARYGELDAIAWHERNSESKTHPVKQKTANAWGLYDMMGNVWEWCGDWDGNYPNGSVTDPMGPSSGSYRVRRGGCWGDYARFARSAFRNSVLPGRQYSSLGFRPVLSSVR